MASLLFVIREPEGLLKTDINLPARVNSLWVRNKGLAFILTYLFEATITNGSDCRCYSLRKTGLKGLEVLFQPTKGAGHNDFVKLQYLAAIDLKFDHVGWLRPGVNLFYLGFQPQPGSSSKYWLAYKFQNLLVGTSTKKVF
jgi:hypothetical protein